MSVLLRTTGSVWREGPAACGFQPLGLKSGFFLVLEGDGHHSDSLATVSWWLPSPGLNSNTMPGLGEYCFSHPGDGTMAGSWPGPRLSGVIPGPTAFWRYPLTLGVCWALLCLCSGDQTPCPRPPTCGLDPKPALQQLAGCSSAFLVL